MKDKKVKKVKRQQKTKIEKLKTENLFVPLQPQKPRASLIEQPHWFSFNRKVNHIDLPHIRPIEQTHWFSFNRKVGRVIDRAGLEIRYTPFGYRGFESLTFRS